MIVQFSELGSNEVRMEYCCQQAELKFMYDKTTMKVSVPIEPLSLTQLDRYKCERHSSKSPSGQQEDRDPASV